MIQKKEHTLVKTFQLNSVIWFLTLSDIFTWGIFMSMTTILGIYLSRKLGVDAIEIIGVGVGIYYLVRAVSQIPIGFIADRMKRDTDDIAFLALGNILIGFSLIFYPLIQERYLYFVLQITMGLGGALNLVNWRKLFAKNLDKDREGVSYAVYDSIMSAAMAIFGVVAGFIANIPGYFDYVVSMVGLVMIASAIWPVAITFVNKRKSKD